MSDTDATAEPRALDQLATALAAFQAEMPTVAKTKTAQVKSDKGSYSYTYAGLADVSEAAMPLLSKHGLSFSTLPEPGVLNGMLLHKSGQYLTASLPIAGGTPQAVGSSLTYMRRYLLGCMTGLVTDDDDDGQTAEAGARKRRTAPTPPAPPAQVMPGRRPAGVSVPLARDPAPDVEAVTPAQITKIGTAMSHAGMTDRAVALAYVARVIGHDIASRNELSKAEAHQVIEALEFDAQPPTPPEDPS